jgi:hypothetical protein
MGAAEMVISITTLKAMVWTLIVVQSVTAAAVAGLVTYILVKK